MKIVLFGRGRTGGRIASLAHERGHRVVGLWGREGCSREDLVEADVCIDFSHADAVVRHCTLASEARKPLIIGTTGWEEERDRVKEIVMESRIGCVAAPNFSVGVYLFLRLIREAAVLFNDHSLYDVGGVEWHHREKVDAPSGTAKAIAAALLERIQRKNSLCLDRPEGRIAEEALQFSSLRCGHRPGTHEVFFDSPFDTITLSHQAHTRDGFAHGALDAAEWIRDKRGFFTLEDMMEGRE